RDVAERGRASVDGLHGASAAIRRPGVAAVDRASGDDWRRQVITTHVVATCDKFSRFNGPLPPSCSAEPVEFDHAPTADELAQALTEAGYVTKDSGHLCPRHADQGERVTVTGDWQEIAPGVLVRAPQ